MKFWTCFAGINGFIAVVMGAVAAHAIADAPLAAIAQKASIYHLIHTALLLSIAARPERFMCLARWAFLSGMTLFCGSLYIRALTGWAEATQIAPLGGIGFMAGWLCIASAAFGKK